MRNKYQGANCWCFGSLFISSSFHLDCGLARTDREGVSLWVSNRLGSWRHQEDADPTGTRVEPPLSPCGSFTEVPPLCHLSPSVEGSRRVGAIGAPNPSPQDALCTPLPIRAERQKNQPEVIEPRPPHSPRSPALSGAPRRSRLPHTHNQQFMHVCPIEAVYLFI